MSALVLDTHALVWYVEASPRLSSNARTATQTAIQLGEAVHVSAVSLVEIAYLVEKRRLPAGLFDRIFQLLRQPIPTFRETPFTLDMADALRRVSAQHLPDMPDRMIAATARHLNLPLVSCDQPIHASGQPVIW
jgi:PIN domain nuclease of toxin-antitoxin system